MYRSCIAAENQEEVRYFPSYEENNDQIKELLFESDVVVIQLLDFDQKIGEISTKGRVVWFPHISGAFLWPYSGQAHPKNEKYDFFDAGGPYPAELGDSYLSKMIKDQVEPELAVRQYLATDVAKVKRIDRLFELVMEKQRARDIRCGYAFSEMICSNFRQQVLFISPNHPSKSLALAMAFSLFRNLGISEGVIDELYHKLPDVPFPPTETPIHPSVISHFSLEFADPDTRYRYFDEGRFTFEESAHRYMNYEWNKNLARGLHLVRMGMSEQALPYLDNGVRECPRSWVGRAVLSDLFIKRGRLEDATVLAKEAVEIEPWDRDLQQKLDSVNNLVATKMAKRQVSLRTVLEIKFGHGGNSYNFTGEGWSNPESNSTWTVGLRAALHIGVLNPEFDYLIVMNVHPFISPRNPIQRINVTANDAHLVSLSLDRPGELKIWLRSEEILRMEASDVTLFIDLPDAGRPSDNDSTIGDDRVLGLSFRNLEVQQVVIESSDKSRKVTEVAAKLESLGVNCEFGMVQRLAGAEPLSLLRFATSRMHSLIPALKANFEGLGALENIKLDIHGEGENAQWMVLDQRYGFVFHTDAHPDLVNKEEILKRETRRLPWLAQKLLRDLREADKTFVYQGDTLTSVACAKELLSVLHTFGPNRLLAVLCDPLRAGELDLPDADLYIGYVDRLERLAAKETISFSAWFDILGKFGKVISK
jgi:hypothetical protein